MSENLAMLERVQETEINIPHQIVNILSTHRRVIEREIHEDDVCVEITKSKIQACIDGERQINMVLPAFPCKSASKRKVLGELPDMAEEVSLRFLNNIAESISEVHSPGAQITICSDGRVFSPDVRVPDETVSEYSHELQRMISSLGFTSLKLFQLEDCFDGSPDALRNRLLSQFGKTVDALQEETLSDVSLRNTHLGITRFMLEEGKAWDEQNGIETSNNQRQKEAKKRAWRIIQGSQAWGALTDAQFPDDVRLSIHPQSPASAKFGIFLMPTTDCFLTPWHGVAVLKNDSPRLVRRTELESLDGEIVCRDGRPSHFVEK